ncbi:MAG TPA: hypothetical protein VKP69_17920 [Isosphaeraceae bacterium]|nr:hypothetical protein [Isosphaeraceae bacterium]
MNLTPGRRLTRGERTAYELVETAWTSTRHTWMRARKVFWNFRYPGQVLVLDEAESDEWLDVLVRVPHPTGSGGVLGDPKFECESVLALADAPWFLEPLDILDQPDAPGETPVLVLADPHAERVGAGPPADPIEVMAHVRMMTEALAMLDHLHRAGLGASALDPEDFLVDPTGRWFFLGTDRIGAAGGASAMSNDLAAWATCVERLLGTTDRGPVEVAWPFVPALPEPARASACGLFERVRRCLDPDPARRPASVSDFGRGRRGGRGALASLRGLFGPRRPLSG